MKSTVLISELSNDFEPTEVLELTKIHCKKLELEIDDEKLKRSY